MDDTLEEQRLEVPPAWEQLDFANLHGVLLVVGAPDVGKTTFARYLFRRLAARNTETPHHKTGAERRWAAFIDGDPGQTFLGPPATFTLVSSLPQDQNSKEQGYLWRYFIGSISPRGHMLPMLVGATRLVQAAEQADAHTLVYDTSGLIDPAQGGLALKNAKIDMLQPAVIFAIQREQELEPLLVPLRRSRRMRVVTLYPSPAVRPRSQVNRRAHRAQQFASHFENARSLTVNWTKLAVFPLPRFRFGQLVAFEDVRGFTLALGIVREIDRAGRQVTLYTALESLDEVNALRLGDIALDPVTFQDQPLHF